MSDLHNELRASIMEWYHRGEVPASEAGGWEVCDTCRGYAEQLIALIAPMIASYMDSVSDEPGIGNRLREDLGFPVRPYPPRENPRRMLDAMLRERDEAILRGVMEEQKKGFPRPSQVIDPVTQRHFVFDDAYGAWKELLGDG